MWGNLYDVLCIHGITQNKKCDNFNLKLLGSILAGAVQFVRKETHSDNVMPYKTSQIAGIFYMQIGAHKSAKKTTFHYPILSYF